MIEIDPNLEGSQAISRYMSLAKFFDLLKRRRLYFCSLAHLSDSHEGSSTLPNMLVDTGVANALDTIVNYSLPATFGIGLSKEERDRLRTESESRMSEKPRIRTAFGTFTIDEDIRYRDIMLGQRAWIDVSCWHKNIDENTDESLAMWKIYGGATESICINTSIEKLVSSLSPSDDLSVYIYQVNYIDHREQNYKLEHPLAPAIHKQRPYSYENEIRVIALNQSSNIYLSRNESGRYIESDPQKLIGALRLSPKSPPWVRELLEYEIRPLLQVPILQSELDNDPIFGE